mgnify:CR=1 FL=1
MITQIEEKRKEFLDELLQVCKKHGLSLGHEDTQGSFLIHPYNKHDADWLTDAIWEFEPDKRYYHHD